METIAQLTARISAELAADEAAEHNAFHWSPADYARLITYRAAVAAGFYSDAGPLDRPNADYRGLLS